MPDMRQLRQFIAVAEELSFRRAADRLNMAQPPLSKTIQRLEDELGAKLLERSHRSVELTAVGERFLDEARLVVLQMDRATHTAKMLATGMIGRLLVGFVPSAAHEVLPKLVRSFRQSHPLVDLRFHELVTADQSTALAAKRIDVGLVRPPVYAVPGVVLETIVREPLVAILPDSHPLARQKTVRLAQLKNEPFVSFPTRSGTGLQARTLAVCQEAGFAPRVVAVASVVLSVVGLVAAGVGIAIGPASLQAYRMKGVTFRAISDRSSRFLMNLDLAWREDNTSPALPLFIATARKLATLG